MKPSQVVNTILSGLDRVLQVLGIVLMSTIAFAVTWQVVSRYVTQASAGWTAELASYSFVWLSMIGIALGVRRGRHMVLDIWEYAPQRRWLTLLIDTVAVVVVVAVLALLVWFGIEGLAPAFRRTLPGLGIAYGWVTLAVPVGAFISLTFAVEIWWRTLHTPRGQEVETPGVLFQPADSIVIKGEI